jgi:DNA-binding HxlR family transcriptional regulator
MRAIGYRPSWEIDVLETETTWAAYVSESETATGMSETPRPGRAVRGSTTGRPLMAALDLLGRRWALRILWELRDGPLGARALRERCDGMSSSVLYERLRELGDAGLIEQDESDRYRLTRPGASLGAAIEPLDRWAHSWARSARVSDPGGRPSRPR